MEEYKTSCRICLKMKKPLCPLFKYKLSGNYAEMLTAIADVKVASNDGLPDKICTACCSDLEKAYLLKTIAERSDRRLRKLKEKIDAMAPKKKIAFNSLTDIKSEIGSLNIKPEPKWEMEVEVLSPAEAKNFQNKSNMDKDIVIADTVIRKVDGKAEDTKDDFFSWKQIKPDINMEDSTEVEYLDDNFFQDDDDDNDQDADYVPPKPAKNKVKFKKPKLNEIKVYKEKRIVKSAKNITPERSNKTSLITCYTLAKNGARGAPILLKRPKDATVLKFHPNYKIKKTLTLESGRLTVREKPLRVVRTAKETATREKEKLVCPVCGILTYTLGNHMSTHQEKKKYTCSQCNKTFSQKANLAIHAKQHTGIKDHICEICGAGFYCQKGLLRHNLIHKGERPFGCTLCPKRFIARCDLNRHLRIHSGYKPYKCNLCAMSFNAKHQLQNHERMHTGERPYTCEVCNVAFTYKVNLNNHVLKVHGINLKFKSIHRVTEDILQRELEMTGETRVAVAHLMPQLGDVPPPAAHETVAGEYQILKIE